MGPHYERHIHLISQWRTLKDEQQEKEKKEKKTSNH